MLTSILIPVFNNLALTKDCISGLADLFAKENLNDYYEIVIIDDGSTDGTGDWIAENYPHIVYLKGDGNLWWSGSINAGMDYVLSKNTEQCVLWWNNDIEAGEGYFTYLQKLLPNKKDIVVGSKIYDKVSGKLWGMGGRFNIKTGKHYQQAHLAEDSPEFNKVIHADWLPGMGTVLHTNMIKEVGMLDDKNFPQYHGDLDYTMRCSLKGYKVEVHPQLVLYNDTSNSGLKSKESFKEVLQNMKSIKSFYNLKKDILLYKKFTRTPFSYIYLIKKYGLYLGGFIKWRLLSLIGVKK